MINYSSVVTIRRPPAEVYAALLDNRRYAQWTEMVDMEYDTPGEPAVGSRGRFRLSKGPIKGALTYELTQVVPDRKIVFQIEHPTLSWTAVSTLAPAADGTRVEYAGHIGLHGWRRLLEPLMAAELRAGEGQEIARLKALLEAEATGEPSVAPS